MAVKKTATGYQIRWYDAEGRSRKRRFRGIGREEAIRLEREILAKRDRGEPFLDRRKVPTFGDFADQWIEEGRARWKWSTLAQYRNVLAKQLVPAFGRLRLTAITESSILQLVTAWSDGGLSPRRINLIVGLLKGILKAATRRHVIIINPSATVRFLPEPRTEVDPLSLSEIESFLQACPAFWRPYFITAFKTGARPSEMAALKWGDVDLKRETARIRAGRARGHEGAPKTPSSIRDLHLLPEVVDALRDRRREQSRRRLKSGVGRRCRPEDYVFAGPQGGHLNMNFIRDHIWYPTLEKAKLRRRIFYQTRHTFASNALLTGEDPSWVARMLGHKTLEVLFETYARFIPNRTRRDGAALARATLVARASRSPDLVPGGRRRVANRGPREEIRKISAEGGT
ncbi:MAG TPA: site-specific integrase [Candidatus Eisenbacteria bacterium]